MGRHRELHTEIRRKFLIKRRRDSVPLCGGRRVTRRTLAEFLGEHGFNKCAEVGVRKGGYSNCLCENIPNIELTCVDPYMSYHGIPQQRQDSYFKQAVERLSKYNVRFLRKTSMDALDDVEDESLDFIYIDGNHRFDYVCPDIIFWSRKLRRGGIMGCHDYYHFGWSGVVEAVDAYTKCHHIDPWYVTKELEPTAFWVKP